MTTMTTPRTGLAYTDDDHDTLLAMLREGASTGEIAVALGRTIKSIEQRARKLLPPGQRHCPLDRVMPTLATVCAEPDYDWRTTISLDDPPAPINRIERVGIEGLTDEQLVECAHAVAVCLPHGAIFELLKDETNKRRLVHEVVRRHAVHRHLGEQAEPEQAQDISSAWAQAVGFETSFNRYHPVYRGDWD
ncbi:hypothetical protein AAEX63_06575 [Luteococcus sp. H138]|uniref:hypothetical protein n=1 Tax=unclassified Luteococcus TaxID=2639923 RepID=UPI00313DEB86